MQPAIWRSYRLRNAQIVTRRDIVSASHDDNGLLKLRKKTITAWAGMKYIDAAHHIRWLLRQEGSLCFSENMLRCCR